MTEAEIRRMIAKMEEDDERIAHEVERLHSEWDALWKRDGFFRLEEELKRRAAECLAQ